LEIVQLKHKSQKTDESQKSHKPIFSEPHNQSFMKTQFTFSLLAAAACGLANAQTAHTDPVGYLTIPIYGKGTGTQKLQLANQGLLPGDAVQYVGVAESFGTDGGGNFLQDDEGTWVSGNYVNGQLVSHLIEITSGSLQGTMTWITSSATDKLYTSDNISSAGTGASFRILKTFTIASLLGNPPTSTVLGGGTTLTAADNLQILDPTTNSYQTFWYKNGGVGGTGWRSTGITNADVPVTAIHPNDGLVFLRKQSSDGSLVITGAVKTTNTKVRVEGDVAKQNVLNIIATTIPVNQLTPANSGLYTGSTSTGLKGGTTLSAADNLLIYDSATNAYTTFWYKNGGVGGTGWRATGVADPANYSIPSTAAILIQRKVGASFTWTVPGVTVAQ
jgi:hypothetical protein